MASDISIYIIYIIIIIIIYTIYILDKVNRLFTLARIGVFRIGCENRGLNARIFFCLVDERCVLKVCKYNLFIISDII